jgi:hypothetical protein
MQPVTRCYEMTAICCHGSPGLIIAHQAPDTAGSVEIPVTLAGIEWNLHFVGKHWFDLKAAFLK